MRPPVHGYRRNVPLDVEEGWIIQQVRLMVLGNGVTDTIMSLETFGITTQPGAGTVAGPVTDTNRSSSIAEFDITGGSLPYTIKEGDGLILVLNANGGGYEIFSITVEYKLST